MTSKSEVDTPTLRSGNSIRVSLTLSLAECKLLLTGAELVRQLCLRCGGIERAACFSVRSITVSRHSQA